MSNGAYSRVLIAKELEFSGWSLLDLKRDPLELSRYNGRADYMLNGPRGPLGVLEAKKEDVDPYDANEQTHGYAENLKTPIKPKLNQANINRIPMPEPPLQNAFANRVAEIREWESIQAPSCRRLDNLFHSLLHRAFTGEL